VAIPVNHFNVCAGHSSVFSSVEKRDVVMTGEGCRDEMAAEKSCPAKNQEFHPLSPDYEE